MKSSVRHCRLRAPDKHLRTFTLPTAPEDMRSSTD